MFCFVVFGDMTSADYGHAISGDETRCTRIGSPGRQLPETVWVKESDITLNAQCWLEFLVPQLIRMAAKNSIYNISQNYRKIVVNLKQYKNGTLDVVQRDQLNGCFHPNPTNRPSNKSLQKSAAKQTPEDWKKEDEVLEKEFRELASKVKHYKMVSVKSIKKVEEWAEPMFGAKGRQIFTLPHDFTMNTTQKQCEKMQYDELSRDYVLDEIAEIAIGFEREKAKEHWDRAYDAKRVEHEEKAQKLDEFRNTNRYRNTNHSESTSSNAEEQDSEESENVDTDLKTEHNAENDTENVNERADNIMSWGFRMFLSCTASIRDPVWNMGLAEKVLNKIKGKLGNKQKEKKEESKEPE